MSASSDSVDTPRIEHRFVAFGASFAAAGSSPGGAKAANQSETLGPREIVVDVGAECFDSAGKGKRMIYDHHFPAPEGEAHPCAAAAVFMHADDILAWRDEAVGNGPPEIPFTIVTHRNPDFDALASAYLVRTIILERWPETDEYLGLKSRLLAGWPREEAYRAESKKIEWIKTGGALAYLPDEWYGDKLPLYGRSNWAFSLAAYASRVDHCKRIPIRRDRRLHSILYAAMHRGRKFDSDGMASFFSEARRAMSRADGSAGLSPLFDELVAAGGEFAPELVFLDESSKAYARDLSRARKALVSLPLARKPEYRDRLFKELTEKPFLVVGEGGEPSPSSLHLEAEGAVEDVELADGIYIRDPECLLFKEWAREDRESSILGEGYLFTAVAYSNYRDEGENRSEYIFSLDLDRAASLHLYTVWAALQAAEIRAMRARGRDGRSGNRSARPIFAARAKGFPDYFARESVWYDGGDTYEYTIVENGSGGTLLRQGRADDLSDDEAASIVSRVLEYCVFSREDGGGPKARVEDYFPGDKPLQKDIGIADRAAIEENPPSSEAYRLVEASLDARAFSSAGGAQLRAEAIGRMLWPFIDPTGSGVAPKDFLDGHLIEERGRVCVWSRYGIAVARVDDEGQRGFVESLRRELGRLVRIRSDLPSLRTQVSSALEGDVTSVAATADVLKSCRMLAGDATALSLMASRPDGILIRRFLSATYLESVIASVSELSEQVHAAQEARRDLILQNVLAWGTALGLGLSWMQISQIAADALGRAYSALEAMGGGVAIAAVFMVAYLLGSSNRRRRAKAKLGKKRGSS